jgi:hypothetical protein
MIRRCAAVAAIVVCGCGVPSDETTAPETVSAAPESVTRSVILEQPFSAEEIRDEWVEGFRVRIRRWTPAAEAFEQWTVVAADWEGVEIESVAVDAEGEVIGPPSRQRSSWGELRDHASFPADGATRQRVSRETPLGTREGWLYVVGNPAGSTVSEFFFAEALPGAPVFVHVLRDEELVEIFEQVERSRPR